MKKILVWKDKHGDIYYDASTEEIELSNYRKIFNSMEARGDFKACPPDIRDEPMYRLAQTGHEDACRLFIKRRTIKKYEYEEVYEEDLIEPIDVEEDEDSDENL